MDSSLGYQNPPKIDKRLDSEAVEVGGVVVERERIQITGRNAGDIAEVDPGKGLKMFSDDFGGDGQEPPAITGTGIRGWLRAIYEKLLGVATEESLTKLIGFDENDNINVSIVTAGVIKTITETNGLKTRTTVIDSTDPLNKSIVITWA